MIVPRTVYADINIVAHTRIEAQCPRGLLKPILIPLILETYRATKHCMLSQVNSEELTCLKEGEGIRFFENPLKKKVCPGTVQLKTEQHSADEILINIVRRGCLEVPPEGYVFCRKHFNSHYGQYIRYIFSNASVNRNNPFFKMPAFLYFIYYGGNILKVGTTILFKGLRRMLEQPILLFSLFYLARNIEEARHLEINISKSKNFSQAPKTSFRIANMMKNISQDRTKLMKSFGCLIYKSLTSISTTTLPKALEGIEKKLAVRGIPIKDLVSPHEKFLEESIPLTTVSHATQALQEKKCLFLGISKGLLIFECEKRVYSIPFEIIRDRILNADVV